jgi:L-ribulose-5-phosphate 4-epimerase
MLNDLKQRVFEQNLALVKHGLVVLTWGNVSARDFETGLVVIKPSGVAYDRMGYEDMVVVDLEGNVVEGTYRPSSDLPTHLYLYKQYPTLGGIVHTHSAYATAFAQSGREIPAYGTTHADAFYGNVPCSRELSDTEINEAYEWNTGKVIVESISNVDAIPAMLVKNHGVFTWGNTPEKAVENAVTLEEVAKMALFTEMLNPNTPKIKQPLLDKHYFRKHGKNAYYGQK